MRFLRLNFKDSHFSWWQRCVSTLLVSVFVANTGLFSGVVHAQTFEVKLGDFRSTSLEEKTEYGLVNVLVESALLDDRALAGHVRRYCDNVQKALGNVCLITPWEGETPSRVVEALQQLYFEGFEVDDGLGKLVGLVVVGEVPIPVVHNGRDSFPSLFPYTDFVNPAYVFDSEQQLFVRSTSQQSQAEIWHGLIRPPGAGEERIELLRKFFEKNEAFYSGNALFSVFRNSIGFQDQLWENDSFDNETKKWYLQKMSVLERIMNYRYSGEWLQELSGEAVDRLAKLTSRTFDDASVQVERSGPNDVNGDIGFSPGDAARQTSSSVGKVNKGNEDVDDYGGGRLLETVPDSYSPGPIRNFLKDYVHVVNRYISGSAELLERAGRRQSYETLASLITKMDKFESTRLFEATRAFETYFYEQAKSLALEFELVKQFERPNDFYSEELTDAVNALKGQDQVGPPPFEEKPKSNILGYGSKIFNRYVNGVPIESVKKVEQCSLIRGSNFVTEDEEPGRAVSLNRKDNPLTAQDISGVSGRKAQEEIKEVYRNAGYCSYMVKDQCMPGASKVPLLDFAASEEVDVMNDYRNCFDQDGPTIPEAVAGAVFHSVPSLLNHDEPRGDTVRAMLEKKLAHFFPIDAVRHVSFFLGGAGQYADRNVGRLLYPNFFELDVTDQQLIVKKLQDLVEKKERELRSMRVEANWKRFEQYLAFSTQVPGRPDFWNYNEINGFGDRFQRYKQAVIDLLRSELGSGSDAEDFEIVEQYLIGDSVSAETEEKIEEVLVQYFPDALVKQNLNLTCEYTYEVPPINVDVTIPKFDKNDIQALVSPLAALDVLSSLEVPKFSPPSISRECENTVAKNTVDEVRSLRGFYFSLGGVQVDIALLHNADNFVEVLDPLAVILYFTPATPPLPPNTNQVAAIKLFEQQIETLLKAPQALTRFSKIVKPVLLQEAGELNVLFQQHSPAIQESLHWLNLSIEGKHREGVSLLSKEKEMLYLVMEGDGDHIDFNLSQLEGSFSPDADGNIASRTDLLDEIRDRERALHEKQQEDREKRALERQLEGEKSSKCGDSVPLLEWPGAVSCWLDEIISGPLIVPADEESTPSSEEVSSTVKSGTSSSVGPGEISLSKSVITLQDRLLAGIHLPLSLKVQWSGDEVVRVVPESEGKVSVIPQKTGVGTIKATFDDGSGPRTSTAQIQVVQNRAFVRQQTTGDVQIGTADEVEILVEIKNQQGQTVETDTVLNVAADSMAIRFPAEVQIVKGKGLFTIRAGVKAGVTSLSVGSDQVAYSSSVPLNVLSGAPAKLVWNWGDTVVGLDREINGVIAVQDAFGNPYRAEGIQLGLVWNEGLEVNGKSGERGTFFVISGELPLRVKISEELSEEFRETQSDGYGYGYDANPFGSFDALKTFVKPRLRVETVQAYPDLLLPPEAAFDIDPTHRVVWEGLPDRVSVGQSIPVALQVQGPEGTLLLQHKKFTVQREFAGEVEFLEIPMRQGVGRGIISAGVNSGIITLLIDDPDFGTLTKRIEVMGQKSSKLQWDDASYVNGLVTFGVSGRDAIGNSASLPKTLATVKIIGEGGEVLYDKVQPVTDGIFTSSIPLEKHLDRIRLEVAVEGFDQQFSKVLQLEQLLTAEQVKNLPWGTPYLMLVGSAFGDHLVNGSVGQSLLYGPASKIQAVTTEIAPHHTSEKVAQIWPSGRTTVGPDMKVEVIWENLKPVLVYSDISGEVGRLFIHLRSLPFEVEKNTNGFFEWKKSPGRKKTILVPETALYESRTAASGDLLSQEGEKLISFDDQQVVLHDLSIRTELFEEAGDVLIFEFSRRQQVLARWYVHLDLPEVLSDRGSALQWQFSGVKAKEYVLESFYAGEGTFDEKGLLLMKKGAKQRNSLGNGRSALDDVRETNGQGFFGDDKSALSFLAGNTVGESTLLQSEGIVNLGDPVISLRQVKHRSFEGENPAIADTAVLAESDFSVGQLVYAPEEGKIRQLLRADVEGDGDDDLIVALDVGERTILRYLEGNGEGTRWGKVSNLLDLGKDIRELQVLQKKSFVVLYGSGQVVLQQNLQGRYVQQTVDFSALKKDVRVVNLQVEDFDRDGLGDLLFLTGDRELWIWYGSQTLQGVQFGVREADRKMLRVLTVRLKDPENFSTAAWLLTSSTPNLLAECQEDRLSCQSKYFRSYEGDLRNFSPEDIDRLQLLIEQSNVKPVFESDDVLSEAQRYLVRLDQLERYRDMIDVKLLNAVEGTGLRLKQRFDFEVVLSSPRKEDLFVLRYDLGADFTLLGKVVCDGCSDTLQVVSTDQGLWSLEGTLGAGRVVKVKFSVEYAALPDFSFQVMTTNEDRFPDIGLNVASNTTGQITVFQSRAARDYTEIIYGENASASSSSAQASDRLGDLMRGVGLDGTSAGDIRRLLLEQQSDLEAKAGDLFDSVHEDANSDGFPDLYQENPFLIPLPAPDQQAKNAKNSLFDWRSYLIPKTNAQTNNQSNQIDPQLQPFTADYFNSLDQAVGMVDDIAADVERLITTLKCSRGCLPLPMNFAFLAPGPINIFGSPAGFDPGLPVFGVSPAPFFIWPPLVPYQATQFRFYISPTLTGGVGMSLCLGPYLLGQCMVFALPLDQLGGEKICDAAKQGLQSIMQGIYFAVGQVNAAVDQATNEINKTGVVKAKRSQANVSEVEGIIGVGLGGGTHNQGINPLEPKVFLNGIPKIFVDWWDRQWEEIINSVTDLPDITIRVPDPSGLFDADYWDKVGARVSGETFMDLQQLYDLINSLPIVNLHPEVLTIQIPWIEPGMLRRIEQSLYQFLFDFMLELVAFLRSFNLPCNITVVRADLFNEIRQKVREGRADGVEEDISKLKAKLDAQGADLDQAEKDFEQFAERVGLAADTAPARQAYFKQLREKKDKVDQLNKSYESLEYQVQRLEQPEKISDLLPVLNDIAQQTNAFWQQQYKDFREATIDASDVSRESAEAIRSCAALKLGADLTLDVDGFVNGIQRNIEALETWKKFPRELAKYLNVFEFYIEEVVKILDQLTGVVLNWWSEFEKKLDLWINVLFAYEEFIALIKLILDILKGYNKKCGLCTSDRLTLKELILKVLFGVVPKFPIINFPTWPDIRLDFSDVQLSMNVAVPVFDVKTLDLKWPKLPQIKFPRFNDFNISATGDLSLNASLKLPDVPLVIPPPPTLPPLPPLPNIPKINLPNLPPAPEVPQILEGLLPLMKIIQTVLDIWCLVNKALIPIDEKLLKTQIENLTNRSLNLILPIDLMLEFDVLPGDLLTSLVPFDTIDVKSTFQVEANIDPLPNLQETIDQQYHQPMNALIQQIDSWVNELRQSSQQGLDAATSDLQGIIDQIPLDAKVEFESKTDVNVDLNQDFSELINSLSPERPTFHSDLIRHRENQIASHYGDLRNDLLTLGESLRDVKTQAPEDLLQRLASLSSENVLVTGAPNLLKQRLTQEKMDALSAPENMVEKSFSLLEKPGLLAQLDTTRSALDDLQGQILGTDSAGLEQWGTAIVRDGEVRRIQDYPLEDPTVAVWENDVFLGYEKALYLKTIDGKAQRHEPYTGRVHQVRLATLQRSAVHQLRAESRSDSSAGSGSSTLRWSWDSPGVDEVELTLWESVGQAQRLDTRHLRFYLEREASLISMESFEVLTAGVSLVEGREFRAQRSIRFRFGEDQVIIPSGMTFSIPSLLSREVRVQGSGTVRLENYSGRPWTIRLGSDSTLEMEGLAPLKASGTLVQIPALTVRPVVKRISSKSEGAMKNRLEVVSGEKIPSGEFYALRSSVIRETLSGAEMTLEPGIVLPILSTSTWVLASGRGEVIVSDDLQFSEGKVGMALMNEELLKGEFEVEYRDRTYNILPEQQVVWSEISASSFDVTVPHGNYYGRIREQDGLRGYSQIVHAAAQPRYGSAQVVAGVEQIAIPIYTPLEILGKNYVIGELPQDSYHWSVKGEESFVSGHTYRHPGFESVGKRTVELFIRNGENDYLGKTFEVTVFLPQVKIDEELFGETRVLRIETQPPVAGIPVGVVGVRDGVEDWLIANPQIGVRLENQFYTDENGIVQLPALEDLEGMNIVIENGKRVARLYPNGRVVLNEEYLDACQNDAFLDGDGYLKFRVSCLEEGRLVTKFEVRMVPDRDTDVSIVEAFQSFDRGVSVRSLQAGLQLVALSRQDPIAPGGVQVQTQSGSVLLILSPDGKIELVQKNLILSIKPFRDPSDDVVWQVLQNENPLMEFVIRGPDRLAVIDPVVRETVLGDQDGDGMLDRWEVFYGVSNANEDPDLDGLTNLQEFQAGSNPKLPDTDGDGLTDGEEVDPLSAESTQKKVTFTDVPEDSPYAEAIKTLSQFGFIQGYGDSTFRPNQPVTRAEALKIIMSVIRCENCEFPSQATKDELDPSLKGIEEFLQFHQGVFENDPEAQLSTLVPEKVFSFERDAFNTLDPMISSYFDVKADDWYYFCVEIATQLGLVNGYRGFENGENALGKFIPNRGVNIAELMKIVIEAIGEKAKESDRVYGPRDGWWNDPAKNYLASAEEDLQLLISSEDYSDPLRGATRAEVAYAAWRVLKENGALDFDGDKVANQADQCPCQVGNADTNLPANGCPVQYGPVLPVRRPENLFEGIEITQTIECRCLVVIPADLFLGSQFFGVITGRGAESDKVFVKSNVVGGG